jgi:hypothetical protein
MKRKKVPESRRSFVEKIKEWEERLFGDALHEQERSFMKSERYFWHFRPSHHVASGLLTEEDIALLSQPGKRLLSIGAHPAFLERLLPQLGVPRPNIVIADNDPAIVQAVGEIETHVFDANGQWPEIGMFDILIFPESLCIIAGEHLQEGVTASREERDEEEAKRLASVLTQALVRLRPGGVIRANGPMSHPNVIKKMSGMLGEKGPAPVVEYQRFFLSIRKA